MIVGLETGNSSAQLDPQNEATTTSDVKPTYPADLIERLGKPLHQLSAWDQAGVQRHIDERVELLTFADDAMKRCEYYLAISCLRQVYENVLHSTDTYVSEYDTEIADSELAPHKLAEWFLQKAIYDVSEASIQPVETPIQAVA